MSSMNPMKILTGRQIREADRATIDREPISSLGLMERASEEIARWIGENVLPGQRLIFCCGKGNNGGDGLAVARMLHNAGFECVVFFAADLNGLSEETRTNLQRLPQGVEVYDITAEQPEIEPDAVVIDALLGTGIRGEVNEPVRSVVNWMNTLSNRVISIDIPSGMSTEWGNAEKTMVKAETTLTLQFPKLAMMLPEAGDATGEIVVLPIGLNSGFINDADSPFYYITEDYVASLQRPRPRFSHKGTFGHALLVCGSQSMTGAAILATGGALRSGCGLVTTHIPASERFAVQANWPSAMLDLDKAECFTEVPENIERFDVIGAGCGLGREDRTVEALGDLLTAAYSHKIPMVLDADALNIISANPRLGCLIPEGSILTPHPGELKRLTGEWTDERDKLSKATALAAQLGSVVVVKGANTVVCTPDGRYLFNSTGTPGMAKGGSGDVLAGYLTGLMARGFPAETCAVTGVFNHGRAGEKAAEYYGQEAMNSADITEFFN